MVLSNQFKRTKHKFNQMKQWRMRKMTKYAVKFQKGNKTHTIKVTAQGICTAVDEAVIKHFTKYTDGLSYEIISVEKIA